MSVKIRPYRRGGWEVDIRVTLPDGTERRERRKAPVSSKSGANRWAQAREQNLLLHRASKPRKEVPTLREFAERFVDGYARANRHKPSGIAQKESILRVHLLPALGSQRLDTITNEDVQRLKVRLGIRAPSTVNNVLTVLSTLLKTAVAWDILERVPCTIQLLRRPRTSAAFHDFDAFERLVDAAHAIDAETHLLVLLGGEAGLRCGEKMALEWMDVNLTRNQIAVQRSEWKGQVTATKGGRVRHVPLTVRLAAALRAHQHLRHKRVLTTKTGEALTQKMVQDRVRWAARKARLEHEGVHILRHTFCSHLAKRGAPARAIQELAGHQDLSTTQRYMHLSPAALDSAIRLLDGPKPVPTFGDMLETGGAPGGGSRTLEKQSP